MLLCGLIGALSAPGTRLLSPRIQQLHTPCLPSLFAGQGLGGAREARWRRWHLPPAADRCTRRPRPIEQRSHCRGSQTGLRREQAARNGACVLPHAHGKPLELVSLRQTPLHCLHHLPSCNTSFLVFSPFPSAVGKPSRPHHHPAHLCSYGECIGLWRSASPAKHSTGHSQRHLLHAGLHRAGSGHP
jgi:hypothetical protein